MALEATKKNSVVINALITQKLQKLKKIYKFFIKFASLFILCNAL